ncbi:hypothetical protein Salat_2621100 [Sesamum alatum]|uniref:Uncharacterized protein n=1 Tax=Sesamum alatum TaxID=300844 RepID=A0AAE1XPA4_9LAMI|nr:hypothetical protein Salat_2621100 [Sesamum alatum]
MPQSTYPNHGRRFYDCRAVLRAAEGVVGSEAWEHEEGCDSCNGYIPRWEEKGCESCNGYIRTWEENAGEAKIVFSNGVSVVVQLLLHWFLTVAGGGGGGGGGGGVILAGTAQSVDL